VTEKRSLAAMGAFAMAGNTPLVVQPMVVGAMVDRLGFTERQAGILASVELTGVTLAILGLIGLVSRTSRATLAVLAVSAIVGANVMTCFVRDFGWLLPLRFMSGVGAAAAFCVFLNIAASREQPENVFAVVNAISIAYSGLLNLVTPAILKLGGLPGIMLTLSFITILALPTVRWMRVRDANSPARTTAAFRIASVPVSIVPLLAMMLFLYTGHGAIWAYQERIGAAAGLSPHAVGKWLGLSMLVWGVLGSLLARLLGMSIGRVWPQFLSLGASVFAVMLLVFALTPLAFAAACGLIAFSWFYGLPYQMGILAARDPKGRVALAGLMMSTGGMALGPGIAAIFLVAHGHWAIGMFAGVCYVCALAIAVPAASHTAQIAEHQPA
jgi:predicted MFS family arabinose efflux permease